MMIIDRTPRVGPRKGTDLHAYWEATTRCGTRGMTDAQIAETVDRLVRAEVDGQISSVWHEAAAVCGTKCHCARCHAEPTTQR